MLAMGEVGVVVKFQFSEFGHSAEGELLHHGAEDSVVKALLYLVGIKGNSLTALYLTILRLGL